jgi:hypothetical protein
VPPKSEFDPVLKVLAGRLFLSGPFRPTASSASGVLDEEPVHIHWRVRQGSRTSSGISAPQGDKWFEHDRTTGVGWEDGPAHAVGLLVTMRNDGAETVPWQQDVTLEVE